MLLSLYMYQKSDQYKVKSEEQTRTLYPALPEMNVLFYFWGGA